MLSVTPPAGVVETKVGKWFYGIQAALSVTPSAGVMETANAQRQLNAFGIGSDESSAVSQYTVRFFNNDGHAKYVTAGTELT